MRRRADSGNRGARSAGGESPGSKAQIAASDVATGKRLRRIAITQSELLLVIHVDAEKVLLIQLILVRRSSPGAVVSLHEENTTHDGVCRLVEIPPRVETVDIEPQE